MFKNFHKIYPPYTKIVHWHQFIRQWTIVVYSIGWYISYQGSLIKVRIVSSRNNKLLIAHWRCAMFHQTIVGKPKCCLNRNCKTQFTKASHLGWLPKSEVEVYAIMRCPKCKDTFAVVQLMSMAHDYRSNLPKDESKLSPNGPITKKETLDFKKKLENKDSLKELMEGYVPGGTILPDETE